MPVRSSLKTWVYTLRLTCSFLFCCATRLIKDVLFMSIYSIQSQVAWLVKNTDLPLHRRVSALCDNALYRSVYIAGRASPACACLILGLVTLSERAVEKHRLDKGYIVPCPVEQFHQKMPV